MKNLTQIVRISMMLSVAAFLLVLGVISKVSAQDCTTSPSGIVAWLPGDGNTNDISGNGNNGTLENGATYATAGKVARSFSFDGVDDAVRVPHNATLNPPSGHITVEAWVNPTSYVNTSSIINKRTPGNIGGYTLEVAFNQGGKIGWSVYVNGGYRTVVSNNLLPLNTFTHVAGTYDGNTITLYFNGQLEGSVNFSGLINPVTADLVIGRNIPNPSSWQGLIDEPTIYDRALSQPEIQSIVAADSAGKCKYTVTSTSDTNDGVCNTAHCSLREAINSANSNLNGTLPDRIKFNISGSGPHTIMPTSALPTVTDPIIIDGYTQPGAMPNTNATGAINAVLKIELNGSSAGSGVNGLTISSGGSTLRGLVVNGFLSQGIRLITNGGNLIEGSFIGTNVSGTAASPNTSSGVSLTNTSLNNTVGGTTPAARNLISGNDQASGIGIGGSNNLIQGNLIGTDATGTIAIGNYFGIQISSETAINNTIGGTTAAARNIISGNISIGINFGSRTVVQGNFIGTDVTGAANLGNGGDGISTYGSNNTIGGSGASNIIAFNSRRGVIIASRGNGNSILSNVIFSNTELGIDLTADSGATGVHPNDAGDADTGSNNLQNYPVLNSSANSSSSTTISGTFNSTASTQFRIEFFSNAACDASGFGEGETFIGFQNATTNASGNATVSYTSSSTIAAGRFITATATDPTGNTSEFSSCIQNLGPTAATVFISGRVMDSNGGAIESAKVTITDSQGNPRTATTDSLGFYNFQDVATGETYIVSASDNRYSFVQPSQVLNVNDKASEVDFIALPTTKSRKRIRITF